MHVHKKDTFPSTLDGSLNTDGAWVKRPLATPKRDDMFSEECHINCYKKIIPLTFSYRKCILGLQYINT